MSRNKFVWLFIFSLAVVTVYLGTDSGLGQRTDDNPYADDFGRDKRHYPVIDLVVAEHTHLSPEELEIRRKKGKPFDGQALVTMKPHPSDSAAGVMVDEPGMYTLPTKESDLIVLGKVTSANAYLSNDRRGIYSEFEVTVSEVFKSTVDPNLGKGKVLTVDRRGGTVRYPTGQTIIYFFDGKGLPRVDKTYLFFLQADAISPNYHIVRGFEFKDDGSFAALDYPLNFGADGIVGRTKSALISALRQKLTKKADQ